MLRQLPSVQRHVAVQVQMTQLMQHTISAGQGIAVLLKIQDACTQEVQAVSRLGCCIMRACVCRKKVSNESRLQNKKVKSQKKSDRRGKIDFD